MLYYFQMPHVVVIAGPNGAGKSTIAPYLLRDMLGVTEFVNADTIAQGLSAFSPEKAAIAAGRVMLTRLKELADAKKDFAFETTLSSRTFIKFLTTLKSDGYRVTLVFMWLRNVDLAISRVSERVEKGGHDIPVENIRRRYDRALNNFFDHYMPIADHWYFFDNSSASSQILISKGRRLKTDEVFSVNLWQNIKGSYGKAK